MGFIADMSLWLLEQVEKADNTITYTIGGNNKLTYNQYMAIKLDARARARAKELATPEKLAEWQQIAAGADSSLTEGVSITAQLYGGGGALNLANKLRKIVTIPALVVLLEEIIKGGEAELKKVLKEQFGLIVESVDAESIKQEAGKQGAIYFNKLLKEKAGITSPITNFYDDTIVEQIGEWAASLLNQQLSNFTKLDIAPFTTLLPPAQIKADLLEFAPVAGEHGALFINQQLSKITKQNIAPFTNFYPPEQIKEDLTIFAPRAGELVAAEINRAAGRLLKKEVHIISTVYPPDKIVDEVDLFITQTINDYLKIHLSGVIKNTKLKSELKDQLTNLLVMYITENVEKAKLQLIAEIEASGIPAGEIVTQSKIARDYVTKILAALEAYKINGVRGTFLNYRSQNRAKINNRARQAKYRTKFREVRTWQPK
jgi:hypothetical protein